MSFAGLFDRDRNEVRRKPLELLTILDGFLKFRRVVGRNSLTEVDPAAPDLVLEVRTALLPGGVGAQLRFEAAHFHGINGGHLLQDNGAFGGEIDR